MAEKCTFLFLCVDRALIFCIQNNAKVKVIDSITQMLIFSFYVS